VRIHYKNYDNGRRGDLHTNAWQAYILYISTTVYIGGVAELIVLPNFSGPFFLGDYVALYNMLKLFSNIYKRAAGMRVAFCVAYGNEIYYVNKGASKNESGCASGRCIWWYTFSLFGTASMLNV